jgi:hypothetical protein
MVLETTTLISKLKAWWRNRVLRGSRERPYCFF